MEIRLKGIKLQELADVEEALGNVLFDLSENIKSQEDEGLREKELRVMRNILKFMARLGINLDDYLVYVNEAGMIEWWTERREDDI